jgi:hypothetical protein
MCLSFSSFLLSHHRFFIFNLSLFILTKQRIEEGTGEKSKEMIQIRLTSSFGKNINKFNKRIIGVHFFIVKVIVQRLPTTTRKIIFLWVFFTQFLY